jgi:hypothetical protein
MAFDFQNASLPCLAPLAASYAENEIEDELKRLFIEVFENTLSARLFDANVLGAAHLGSFDLVRQCVNADGLVLLQGDREEAATRYLYRAWKSGNMQGRGLHFIKTYLQMLFPNQCEVEQLWQDKTYPYPTALNTIKPSFAWWLHQIGEPGLKLDGTWGIGRRIEDADESRADRVTNTSGMFLTSRILISLGFDVDTQSVAKLIQVFKDVLPARLVPVFRFWMSEEFILLITGACHLWMQKNAAARYPWCGRVISDDPALRWKLGIDGAFPRLPLPFGTFKLGHLYGGKSNWHLRNCRVSGSVRADIHGEAPAWRVETLPPDSAPEYVIPPPFPTKLYRRPRRLDGRWKVGSGLHVGAFKLDGSRRLPNRKMNESPRFGSFKIIDYRPPVPVPPAQARLTLSGAWKLGGPRNAAFEFFRIVA